MSLDVIIALALAAATGWILWLRASQRASFAERQNCELRAGLESARSELKQEAERRARAEASIDSQTRIENTFQALSTQALKSNSQDFLAMMNPLKESLARVDTRIGEIEKQRISHYAGISEQMRNLAEAHGQLRIETSRLVSALRSPTTRGRWGEMQLRRVVEMAGMVEHCDFTEQPNVTTGDIRLRPDMIIRMPSGLIVVVDSKVPLSAYLEAQETSDENIRNARLRDHARQVKMHLMQLASKSYWSQFDKSPEFVVAFLPGEVFLSAALQQDPALLEASIGSKVIPATPTTLVALLTTVAYGWREEKMAKNAQQVSEIGRELYDRLRLFASRLDDIQRHLGRTVDAFNKAAGSFESRVLVSARRFQELGAATSDPLDAVKTLESTPRPLLVAEADVLPPAITKQ